MRSDLALEVDGLGKRYLLNHQEKHRYMGEAMLAKLRNPFAKPNREEFWALKDVSFQVEKGDVLGVIGRNGAGKSTLLKILSQIAEPTEGEIRLHGRIGSLLEVGTGFHPELTGRENIFLNGTILGMRRREVERQFDAIVEFSEVERFLDTPVKRYSSGMYVRLAFAVAAHLNPEILVVDEVLAVGDAQFQAKCLGKMKDISKEGGRTVLFVSHNMAAVRTLCNKCALLKGGGLEFFGDTNKAIDLYSAARSVGNAIIDRVETISPGIVLDEISCNGSPTTEIEISEGDEAIDIVIRGRADRRLRASLEVTISDLNDLPLAYFGEGHNKGVSPLVEPGPFEWHARIGLPASINEGQYVLGIDIANHNVQYWIRIENAVQIHTDGVTTITGRPLRYSEGRGFVTLSGDVSRCAPSI